AFLDVLLAAEAKGEAFGEVLVDRNISHIRPVAVQTEETDTSEKRPRKVYGRALQVVDSIFRDVRLGKIPSSAEAMDVVKSMVQLTLAEPHALFALSMLKDYDNYTFTHSVNVSVIALAVGRACSLSEEKLRMLGLGGLLHDLGKLKIAREIITKPGRLNEEEFAEIRKHPGTGAEIAAAMEGVTEEVVQIVLGHHLGFDDRGYPPEARTGEKSPLVNMVAIADTYDAITTLRSYQRPVTPRRAVACLREISGTALHPEITERFIASLGTYPVGSLVRLDNNEIGLVVWVDTKDPDSVRLKILFDENGRRLEVPLRLDLPGPEAGRIVAEVDPFIKGVEVTDYFD
ncbi:MAG: HD domain-containing protein, partial [Desulfuromonadales bacterium]